jgi:hypothetical protein
MQSMIHASQISELGTTLFETRRGVLTLDEVRAWLNTGVIVRLFNSWAVTDYGVECMVEYYPIERACLTTVDWERQLLNKSWMTARMMRDLQQALAFAQDHFRSA